MKYQSTRNHALTASPAAAVLRGIAPDGGLYMPEAIPVLDWQSLMKEDTLTMSARILSALLPDYEDMPALVRRGYAGKFEAEDLTPLVSVGDRYVLENMRKNGYNIGGEQSGHIIFREYMPTGDGELSAIQLMRVMKKTGEPLSVLAGRMPITPQVLLNVAADRDMKEALHESPEMEALIEECEERLGDTGRILIRASGTEPLIRVMVEGEDAALIRELAERLAAGCEKLLK